MNASPARHPWISDRDIEKYDWLIENAKDGSLLVLVPGGKFLAGGPPFEVDIPAFYLGLTCVTNRQYERFIRETGHRKPETATYGDPVWTNGSYPADKAEHPVVCVDWNDATAYARWAGLQLPSELQWEKGARYLDGRKYPWGGEWDKSKCRNDKNKGNGQTASVWDYPSGTSEWGGYQLSGNVWEWCADWYDRDAYNRYRTGDLKPPSQGTTRVVLGGSWYNDDPDHFTTSCRDRYVPDFRSFNYGFRCMCETVRPPRVGS